MHSAFQRNINVHIYMDDSKNEDWVGFTAVLPSQTPNSGLPGEALIFTAKMYISKTEIEEFIENSETKN